MLTKPSSSVYLSRRKDVRPATPLLSLIVPVFDEEDVIRQFLEATRPVLEETGLAYEYIFIDDGSRDSTADILADTLKEGLPGRLIGLSRNFGKEAALSAGLEAAKGDIAVIIDADLQDPPELMHQMIDGWRAGYDVVYGLRVDRSSDTLMKRSTAGMFYRLFDRLANIRMPANAGDFRLIDRAVIDALLDLPERNRFMKGLFAWVGFPAMAVPYERPERAAGAGKFNYWKLWNFALDGFTGFTTLPLRIWFYGGAVIAFLAFAYALYLIARVFVTGVDVPGYSSLMVALLFFSGVQLLSIGMIGEYIARLFNEAKQRPIYIVQDVIEGQQSARATGQKDDQHGA
ncbi:glycosyltransferase [Roseibium denhamense]|uniref:Glycosyltransferase involved in cell wall bisynthesis n=1 Tax=Roseibium denhamense TaxID=76305 RepID=A0ABY1P7F7_9HYPH|nr:glycosyltransferase family 2 protein [Roseibium denhamense]MTI04527.1 glycosyltransferase [Roseibium denhamense]SMP28300.1 Glycosyltransferase involved in cell wall bisynthesis [Roseibium denhamense]